MSLPSAFQEGVEAAQTLIDTLQEVSPQPPVDVATLEPLYAAAYGALSAGNYSEAQAGFMVLVAHAPTDPRFFAGLAAAQLRQGLLDEAAVSYALANHLDPDNLKLRVPLAEVLMALKRNEQAELLLMQVKALTKGVDGMNSLHDRANALLQLLAHDA